VGEITDEAHGIGQHDRGPVRQADTPQGRIERGKQLVGDQHTRAGQPVEQGRLAGVCIANERNGRNLGLAAHLSGGTALPGNAPEPLGQ
jgi:hypothetical protein